MHSPDCWRFKRYGLNDPKHHVPVLVLLDPPDPVVCGGNRCVQCCRLYIWTRNDRHWLTLHLWEWLPGASVECRGRIVPNDHLLELTTLLDMEVAVAPFPSSGNLRDLSSLGLQGVSRSSKSSASGWLLGLPCYKHPSLTDRSLISALAWHPMSGKSSLMIPRA